MSGTRLQPEPSLGLEPTWLELKPDQNPWYLVAGPNKAQVLMSHCRRTSVRDKVIGKKWLYSDSERNILHKQECGAITEARALQNATVSSYRLDNFIC